MNTAWITGFVVGILAVAIVCAIVGRIAARRGGPKREYDERQQIQRGKAFTAAYATLLIYLAAWLVLTSLEVPFFGGMASILIGVLLSIGVFVGYSIFHDAYFRTSDSPKAWIGIFAAATLFNLVIGVGRAVRGATLQERLLDNANLLVGILLLAILACVIIKRVMDRRAGE